MGLLCNSPSICDIKRRSRGCRYNSILNLIGEIAKTDHNSKFIDMLSIKFLLTLICLNSRLVVANSIRNNVRINDLTHLVKGLIENEEVPSVLWTKTGWSKILEINFIKSISILSQAVNSNMPADLTMEKHINKQWFFLDMNCERKLNILSMIDEKYFAPPYQWIIADATNESIEKLSMLPNSNIILINQDMDSRRYILKQGNFEQPRKHGASSEHPNSNVQSIAYY